MGACNKYTDDGTIIGTVNNYLRMNRGYNFGDSIKFKREHVYIIHTTEFLSGKANVMGDLVHLLVQRGVPLEKIPYVLDRFFTKTS